MLNLSKSKVRVSATRPVAAGVSAIEEGLGLNGVLEGGVLKVKSGVGGANTEAFAGFALNERTAPTLFPCVITGSPVVLLETGKWGIRIPKAVTGTPNIRYAANNAALTEYTADSDAVLEAGEYRLSTATNGDRYLETIEADLGKKLNVVYTYTPTVNDLLYLGGDNTPTSFTSIAQLVGETGVIEDGEVWTSNFDPTIDWNSWLPATGLKIAANGIVTTAAGMGATIKGRIVGAPTADEPFLGIDFSVNA